MFKCRLQILHVHVILTSHTTVMSTQPLITRVREHLDFNSIQRLTIKGSHFFLVVFIRMFNMGLKSFTLIKKCQSEFHTKLHKALLIKKDTPKLNRQLYAKGASFLVLSVLNWSNVSVRK